MRQCPLFPGVTTCLIRRASMKDQTSHDSSSDSSLTNSFGQDAIPELSLTAGRNADCTVSTGKELTAVPEGLSITGFRILRLLGRGGMGVVYEAVEEELNRHVALKVLPASALVDHRQVARFKNEARAVAQLHHENIVPIYKVGSDQGIHYYTMQLIEGQNLSQIISSIKDHKKTGSSAKASDTKRQSTNKTKGERRRDDKSIGASSNNSSRKRFNVENLAAALTSRRGGAQDLSMYQSIAEFGAEIAGALAHAHDSGVIHRDVKPSNILVDEHSKPWITDFGLAIVKQNSVATRPGDIVGTYRYMSPEQATGRRFLIDHRTDIYSLGVTLYELVTQKVPFPGSEPHEILRQVSFDEPIRVRNANPAIPEELETIITKAISKNPHDRYESAQEMADDLRRFATGRPILAKRASVMKRIRRWVGQHQGLVLAASIILLVTLASSISASTMIWTAYKSEHHHREVAEDALRISEGGRLGVISHQVRDENPGLALILAAEAAKLSQGPEINSAMIAALAQTYEQKTLYPTEIRFQSTQLSPDGKWIAAIQATVGQAKSGIVLIDKHSGQITRKFGESEELTDLLFHPSSNQLLTASSSGLVKDEQGKYSHRSESATLWDLRKSESKIVLEGSTPLKLQKESYSRDGKVLVLPSAENTVSVYDGFSGERRLVFQQHTDQVLNAVLSADGSRVASIDSQGQVQIWDPVSGKVSGKLDASAYGSGSPDLTLSADGTVLVIATPNGTHSFDVSLESPVKLANWREPKVCVHPSQAMAACYWTASGKIQIRSLKTGQSLTEVSLAFSPEVVRYSADGRFLLVANRSEVDVVVPFTAEVLFRLKGHASLITALSVDDSFESIVTASTDKTIRVWGTRPVGDFNRLSRRPATPIPTRDHWVATEKSIAFATDAIMETSILDDSSNRLRRIGQGAHSPTDFRANSIVIHQDQFVRIIDSETSRKLAEVSFPKARVTRASYCGETDLVLVQLHNEQLFLWNVADQSLKKFQSGRNQITDFAVSPDGLQIALIGHDGLCSIHGLADGRMVRLLPHADWVASLEWSKTKGIFTLDNQGVLRRWSIEEDSAKPIWIAKTDNSNAIRIHELGEVVVSYHAWEPKKCTVWKIASGEESLSVLGMPRMSVALHPENPQALLTSSVEGASLLDLVSGNVKEFSKSKIIGGEFLDDEIVLAEVGVEQHALNHPTFFKSDSGSCSLKFFDVTGENHLRKISLDRRPSNLSKGIDGKSLLLSIASWHVAIYDRESLTEYLSPPLSANVSAIRYVPKHNRWLVTSSDGSALLLDNAGKPVRTLIENGPPIITAAVNSDGNLFAVGDASGGVRIFERETGTLLVSHKEHSGPIVQCNFIDRDRAVLTLGEDGKVVKASTVGTPTQHYSNERGIQSVLLFADQTNAVLLCGADTMKKPPGDGQDAVASIRFQTKAGTAEVLNLNDFTVTPIESQTVISGDINSKSGRFALADDKGNIITSSFGPWTIHQQWTVAPRRADSIRWVDDQRISVLDDDGGVSVWDSEKGQLVFETGNANSNKRQMVFRHQWNPLDNFSDALVISGNQNIFCEQPLDILSFGQKRLPRSLDPDEKMLFLNPHVNLGSR